MRTPHKMANQSAPISILNTPAAARAAVALHALNMGQIQLLLQDHLTQRYGPARAEAIAMSIATEIANAPHVPAPAPDIRPTDRRAE